MATPNVGILTTVGKALIDQVNAGKTKITFSKIVFSSMDNSQLSDMQVKALTAIAPQEVVVSSPETTLDTNSGETRIRATGTNEKLADGVYVKTYGVFAKDDTGSEILYGVTVSPNPNYFPAYDGVTPQAVTYSYKTVIQETSNITMTNSNDVYASQEDLTEALQPYAKTIDVNQQLDKKVVDNKDGTEQLNGIQVQPYNKLSDVTNLRNIVLQTDSVPPYTAKGIVGETIQDFSLYSGFSALPSGTQIYYSYDLVVKNADGGIHWLGWSDPWGPFVKNQHLTTDGIHHFQGTTTIPDASITSGQHIHSTIDGSHATYQITNLMIVVGSIPVTHLPAPEDKVNVSDMRKPASDVAGIEEVNAKQDKIGYTPADDSKVAHLSGANNFDTVPTVKNNPLLLASSLPSDLARTGSNQEFTGKNTFDTAPIDKTTGNPYITKDGVPAVPSTLADTTKDANFTGKLQKSGIDVATKSDVTNAVSAATANMADSSKPTNFTAGLKSGGLDVATAADLKSIEASAWRLTALPDVPAVKGIHMLYKIDAENNLLYIVLNGKFQSLTSSDTSGLLVANLSAIVKGISGITITAADVGGSFYYPVGSSAHASKIPNFVYSGTKLMLKSPYTDAPTIIIPGGNDLSILYGSTIKYTELV
ncbi:hypothetical protein [Levilactobacillus brevis]|uniref:hypothetical protein n=1 Tax=Levilactobacillus brevis TaxID=1580 RepID=UPI0021A8B9C8|nr:hypothetical protein [Levilactobacillus brevis]